MKRMFLFGGGAKRERGLNRIITIFFETALCTYIILEP